MLATAFATALLTGLTGSVHCVAMCGGYVAAQGAGDGRADERPRDRQHGPSAPARGTTTFPLLSARRLARARVAMQAGRLCTYVAFGGVLGAAGGGAFALAWPAWQQGLVVAANLTLLCAALAIAGAALPAAAAERAGLAVFRRAVPLARPWLGGSGLQARFAMGVLWGLTPCALIYGVAPLALLSGNALTGAGVMLGLWLGTLPALLCAGSVLRVATARLRAQAIRLTAAAIVAAFALAGLWRALALPPLRLGTLCIGG
jgi:sulfite exporter TauE/SafE